MLKAAVKMLFMWLWILLCLLFLWIAYKAKKPLWRNFICSFGSYVLLRIMGVHVHVKGELETKRPLLLVSNHLSYLDILALGSKSPARFTPKSDMAGWPIISLICRFNGSIFVERKSDKIKNTGQLIADALNAGEVVSLFPEGTTGNGTHLLPFKSSLLSIAETKLECGELWVQPVAIGYTHIRRLPIDSTQWPKIAWYGDMVLLPHLWEFLQLGRVDVTLIFLPAVTLQQCGDRKRLAAHCQQVVADALGSKYC